jgi:hypothetical protein
VKSYSPENIELFKSAYNQFWDFAHKQEFDFCVMEDHYLYEKDKKVSEYYDLMEIDFTREILNLINKFGTTINKIIIWNEVYSNYHDEVEREDLIYEFIKYPMYYCLHQPKAIQQKILLSSIQLCNQADIAINNARDYIPQNEKNGYDLINCKTLKEMSKKWDKQCKLVKHLKKLPSKEFNRETKNYRDSAQHQIPPYIEYGNTNFLRREKKDDSIKYWLGGKLPLRIKFLIPVLKDEHKNCQNVFLEYWELIKKHQEYA